MINFIYVLIVLFPVVGFSQTGLAGKTFLFKYEGGQHYRVGFGPSQVTWEGILGDETGRSETDPYQFSEISPETYFVHWMENDGTFVAMTVNLKSRRLVSAGVAGSFRWYRSGDVEEL